MGAVGAEATQAESTGVAKGFDFAWSVWVGVVRVSLELCRLRTAAARERTPLVAFAR